MEQPPNSNIQQLPQNPYKVHQQNQNVQPQQPIQNMQNQNQSFQQQFQNQTQTQNQSIQQSTNMQNQSMQQQYPNQSMQPNMNSQQQQSLPTTQESIPNTNNQQQMQQSPYQNNQSQQIIGERKQPFQLFTVKYNDATFLVDPSSLYKASLKFKELTQPFIQDIDQMREMHLDILNVQFSKRNVNNFLRICQNQPSDVKNSEMKEICEIAKLFQANDIYNTGLSFIQQNIDPNFFVPDNKYDGSDGKTYLIVQGDSNFISHDPNLDDSYFEENTNNEDQGNYYKINDQQDNQNPENSNSENKQKESNFNLDDHSNLYDPVFALDDSCKTDNTTNNESQNEESSQQSEDVTQETKDTELGNKKYDSVIYYLRFENHTFKCPVFKFVKDNTILFSAKQKYEDIYIAEGNDIHISKKENHVGHITQNDIQKINRVHLRDVDYVIKYVNSGAPEHFSLDVSFPFKNDIISWVPKKPRYDPTTDKYYLNFHGQHNHAPLISSKNIVLQDKAHKPTFIVRKMDRNVFEVECQPVINPLIVFTIGLSDIVGPYLDPYTNIEYLD